MPWPFSSKRMKPPGEPVAVARPGRPRRRLRLWVRVVMGIGLALPVILAVLTQGPVATWIASGYVRVAMGAGFDARWTSLKIDGRLVFTGVELRDPGVSGPGAVFAQASRVEVDLDWTGMGAGRLTPMSVRVESPVFRLSQDKSTGGLNIAGLRAPSGGGGSAGRLPRVDLLHGMLELCEHDAASVRVLVRQPVRGWVGPMDMAGERYLMKLYRPGTGPGERLLDGELNVRKGEGTISLPSVDLSRWGPETMPTYIRSAWAKMRLRGQVSGAELTFAPGGRFATEFRLSDVALNVPTQAGRREIVGDRQPRMENVRGTIRFTEQGLDAALDGLFEDLPCKVTVRSEGTDPDAPYHVVIQSSSFRLEKEPRLLWFMPELVRRNFERFGGPTALVDARIDVKRGPAVDAKTPQPQITGSMKFREGQAAFERFPYPMSNLAGTFVFDELEMRMVELVGRSESGARLFAQGRFALPVEDKSLDLEVTITDLPIDAELEKAIAVSKGGSELLASILSRRRYQELIERGLVVTPQRQREASARLGELESGGQGESDEAIALRSELARPVFAFGGTLDRVVVRVTHPKSGGDFVSRVGVKFRSVGLVPDVFAYPLFAQDMSLSIDDDGAVLEGKTFRGLRGGVSSIRAAVRLDSAGRALETPRVSVNAADVPVDDLLLGAIPEDRPENAGHDGASSVSVKRLLRALRPTGNVDASATIGPGAGGGSDYAVTVTMNGLSASPAAEPGRASGLEVINLGGAVTLRPDAVKIVGLSGDLIRPEVAGATFSRLPARFRLDGSIGAGGAVHPAGSGAGAGMDLGLSVRRLDLELRLEDLLTELAPGAHTMLSELRGRLRPQGQVDIHAGAKSESAAAPIRFSLGLSRAQGVELDALGGRVGIEQTGGSLKVQVQAGDDAPPASLVFEQTGADVEFDAEPVATLVLNGEVVTPGADRKLGVTRSVRAQLAGVRPQSGLVRKLVRDYAPALAGKIIDELAPGGRVDADVRLTPIPGAVASDWTTQGELRPHELTLTRGGVTTRFPDVTGEVRFGDTRGEVVALELANPDVRVRASGEWATPAGGDWSAQGTASVQSRGISPDLLALLPGEVRTAMQELELSGEDPIWVDNASVRASGDAQGVSRLSGSGVVNFAGVSARLGVPVSDAEGTLGVKLAHEPGDEGVRVGLTLDATGARVGGLDVERLGMSVQVGPQPGRIEVPSLSAGSYGGRLSGAASVRPRTGGGQEYALRLEAAGVRFADLLADRAARGVGEMGPPTRQQDEASREALRRRRAGEMVEVTPAGDLSRGRLDAELSVAGSAGDGASRRGRGSVRIAGGDVVQLPLVVPLIELSNFAFPAGSTLDFAQADYYLAGDLVTFDQLGVSSQLVQVNGRGTVRLPELALDLRFVSENRTRVPVVSDVIEAVRNELVTITVSGTLENPSFGTETLGGVRRTLGTIFGAGHE